MKLVYSRVTFKRWLWKLIAECNSELNLKLHEQRNGFSMSRHMVIKLSYIHMTIIEKEIVKTGKSILYTVYGWHYKQKKEKKITQKAESYNTKICWISRCKQRYNLYASVW